LTVCHLRLLRLALLGVGDRGDELGRRRCCSIDPVGSPAASSSQCRRGYSYGELRIGLSKNGLDIQALYSRGDRTFKAGTLCGGVAGHSSAEAEIRYSFNIAFAIEK
jgi:hypothetical protein